MSAVPRRDDGGCARLRCCVCGGDDGDSGAEPSPDNPQTVRVQLDWTPNTNHIGIYVALAKGWYEEAGIEVDILPYTDVNPDTVVANGKADIGVSFPPNVIFSRAAGLDLVSVAAVLQSNVTELAVLDSSSITAPARPRRQDLRRLRPALRGAADQDGDQGRRRQGRFTTATLSTAAYEALYNKRADFTEIFVAWEGIEAEHARHQAAHLPATTTSACRLPSVVLVAEERRRRASAGRRCASSSRSRGAATSSRLSNPERARRSSSTTCRTRPSRSRTWCAARPRCWRRSARAQAARWGGQDATTWNAYTQLAGRPGRGRRR